jgi:outer membrane protein OmpA-like peptidoglycan-associated protein/sugar lactone lactonase YvrE
LQKKETIPKKTLAMIKKILSLSLILSAVSANIFAQFINVRPYYELPQRDSVLSIAANADGKKIWVVTNKNVFLLQEGKHKELSAMFPDIKYNSISRVFVDSRGNTWFGTVSEGVFALTADGKKLSYALDSYQDKSFPVSGFFEDPRGNKWVGTYGGGTWQIDKDNFEFFYNTQSCGINGNIISGITADTAKMNIFATEKGLSLSKSGYKWEAAGGKDFIAGVAADQEGNLWTAVKKGKSYGVNRNNKVVKLDIGISPAHIFSTIYFRDNFWLIGGALGKIGKDGTSVNLSAKEKNLETAFCTAAANVKNEFLLLGTADGRLISLTWDAEKDKEPEKIEEKVEEKIDTVAKVTEVKPEKAVISFNGIEVKKGAMIKLDKILFVPQGFDLSDTVEVFKLLMFLKENPKVVIELAGHTDKDPPKTHPQYRQIMVKQLDLSKKRVQTVSKYLTERGIERARIITTWYGGSKPITFNEAQSHINRRVEMKIVEIE